jgi:hypothetical protein
MFGWFPGDLGYVSPGANVQAVGCLGNLPLLKFFGCCHGDLAFTFGLPSDNCLDFFPSGLVVVPLLPSIRSGCYCLDEALSSGIMLLTWPQI